jgi:RNA polymerase sigma factor (sigma-70 family)
MWRRLPTKLGGRPHVRAESSTLPLNPTSRDDLIAYRPRVLAWCRKFFPTDADAEDAVQETLLRAWDKRDGFRGDCSYTTWLFKVCRTTCLNLLRDRKGIDLSLDDPDLAAAEPADKCPSPETLAIWKQIVDQVKSQLKECERLIFELTYALQMTSEECARALPMRCGLSATGVRSVLARRIATVIEGVRQQYGPAQ